MVLCQQVSAHETVHSELHDAQEASSRLEVRWNSACEHAEGTECHLLQDAQDLTVPQARLALKKSRSRALEEVVLNARDAVAVVDQS